MASTEDADDLFLTISDVLDNSKKQSSSSTRQKGSSLCTYLLPPFSFLLIVKHTNCIIF